MRQNNKKTSFKEYKKFFLPYINVNSILRDIQVVNRLINKHNNKNTTRFNAKKKYTIDRIFELKGKNKKLLNRQFLNILRNLPKWENPFVVHNITPTPIRNSLVFSFFIKLFNPNCLWDYVSGGILDLEKKYACVWLLSLVGIKKIAVDYLHLEVKLH